jgi:predicted ATPase/signal transduction histidine kinase
MEIAGTGVKIPGFRIIAQIYAGARTLVYRAIRESDEKSVILKLMRNYYPSFKEIIQFRNQYAIAKNLQTNGIAKADSLEPYGNGYVLVMEDFESISLKEWRAGKEILVCSNGSNEGKVEGKTDFLWEFLSIAIEITTILQEVHEQQVIHKDIKPANILINPATKCIKLIDFSIASLLPRETQQLQNPNLLEGTLAYISPEQTGRMNRGIDYRSDFYSLGVTFFELLTGQLPFNGEDPMELVHCHIAKLPPLAHSIISDIPPIFSEIINKLMAKNAEDRYQTAMGLKSDLEVCLQQLKENGYINSFELGQKDISERFIIPEKLYGREAEVEILLEAFERVAFGRSEIVLVTGFSGIGKTAVVNEVHKPIVAQRGYFIRGKYEQFQRNVPFSAFVQAFRHFMWQLLGESDAQIAQWQSKILAALGDNGQVIIDVIPELESIIGKQPSVAELQGSSAENRFNLLFKNFIHVFTTKEHPLVIFLDDLQWADAASLKLIELLINENETGYLLLIGAYRDNEVTSKHLSAHPLMLTLGKINDSNISVNKICLFPLTIIDINYLIADTLNCSPDITSSLSKLIYDKTQGNPFFTNQFLRYLYEEGMVLFNKKAQYWECDIAKLKQLVTTDDVVEFMLLQLHKLPSETQEILKLAACIGNQFDLNTLAIVSEQSQSETALSLWKGLQEGLILPTSGVYKYYQSNYLNNYSVSQQNQLKIDNEKLTVTYKFLHDRVQQAAYSLIPKEEKKITHFKIGKLLLKNTPQSVIEEKIFEIVNQLNQSKNLATEPEQRYEIAELNLIAGRKAKMSTAYVDAFKYLMLGINFLTNNCHNSWENQYELTLALHQLAAESAYLSGNFQEVEKLIEILLIQVKKVPEQSKIYEIKIQAYVAQNQLLNAIQAALVFLRKLGVELPETVTPEDSQNAFKLVADKLADKEIEDLINLPVMTDQNMLAAMQILGTVTSAVYIGLPELYPLIALKQIELSLIYGNADISAYAYATYGLILCGIIGDVDAGYRSAQLALSLLETFQVKVFKAKIFNLVYPFVHIWKQPVNNCLKPLLNGYEAGLETGDLEFAAYCVYNYCKLSYCAGVNLVDLAESMGIYEDAIVQIKQETALNFHQIGYQAVLNLIGDNSNPCELIGKAYNEKNKLPQHQAANDRYSIASFYIHKLILFYTFSDYTQALQMLYLAEQSLDAVTGAFQFSLFYFYGALSYLATYPNVTPHQEEHCLKILEIVANYQQKIKNWSELAPMNFLHKFYLIEAESSRVTNKYIDAMEYYDKAIAAAKENQYLNEEAIGNELAAKFYLQWGKEKIAQAYIIEAYYCYIRWGAKAKVEDLKKNYSQLLAPIFNQQNYLKKPDETISLAGQSTMNPTTTKTSTSVLDFATVMKVTQALSKEIELDKLLYSLIQIITENAGASDATLLLIQNNILEVAAKFSSATGYYVEEERRKKEEEITVFDITKTTLSQNNQHQNNQHQNNQHQNNQPIGNEIVKHEMKEFDEIPSSFFPLPSSFDKDLPFSIINKVKRLQEIILINDVASNRDFSAEPYFLENAPKSLLCQPIINQRRLIGIIYLENKFAKETFTDERVEFLQILCTQAAISIENAILYNKLEEKVKERTQELSNALLELKATQKKLVESEKMAALGSLVAGVAHEINTPIGTSITVASTLADETDSFLNEFTHGQLKRSMLSNYLEVAKESTDIIVSNLERAGELVQSFKQVAVDQSHLERREFSIKKYIRETLISLAPKLRQTQHTYSINGDENISIDSYPGALAQIVTNLVLNSLIHGYKEGTRGQLRFEITQQASGVSIQYSDDGCGIPEENIDRVFEPFFTTARNQGGTGLGLHIVYNLVNQKLQGTIDVKSQVGLGTIFIIALPLRVE